MADERAALCRRAPRGPDSRQACGRPGVHRPFRPRPRRGEPLYSLDTAARLALVADIERQLGVIFTDEDIEFVETEGDLAERGAMALLRRDA